MNTRLPAALALLGCAPLALLGQSTNADNVTDEEVVALSPFVVESESDAGYNASQTLAGTRLKTRTEDVAASIQILTSEFLEDVGATDINDLFLYTTNTESAGLNGNFSAAVTGETSIGDERARVDPQGAQRIRGLAAADVTRNYFSTILPTDSFNTDRVEINRGANAILFGLGSPAGIANTGLTPAQMDTFGEVKLRADNEGSFRAEATYNTELIEDRLALRIGVLRDDTKYQQEPAFEDDERLYLATTAKPWNGATFRAFYEDGERHANRPSNIPPASTIDAWFGYGDEVRGLMREALADAGVDLAVPDSLVLSYDADLQDLYVNNYLTRPDVNRDGSVDAQDDADRLQLLMNRIAFHQDPSNRYLFHPNMSRQIARVFHYDQAAPGGAAGGVSGFMSNVNARNFRPSLSVVPSALDPSGNNQFAYNYLVSQQPWRQDPLLVPMSLHDLQVFDFTQHLLSGNSGFQDDDWDQFNLTFEQLFWRNRAGIELAYDHQQYHRESFVPFQGYTGIFIDLMQNYLGYDNPNFGRPFVQSRTDLKELDDTREAFRATAFVRLNPRDYFPDSRLTRLFGEQTFTVLGSTYDQAESYASWNQYYVDDNGGSIFSTSDPLGNQRRIMNYIVYLSDQDVTTLSSPTDVRLNRMQNQQLWNPGQTTTIKSIDPNTGDLYDLTLKTEALIGNYRESEQQVDTFALNWNGKLLNDHLIGLVGWRKDTAYNASYVAQPGSDDLADLNNLVLNSGGYETDSETLSWSVVAHVPQRLLPDGVTLGAHYGRSENFSLAATPNDFSGDPIPAPSGETEEYGLTFSAFDQRLHGRLNWFETTLKNRTLFGTDNVYDRFINQGLMGIYENMIEAEYAGFQAPSIDPDTGELDPGTPNHDRAMAALAQFRTFLPEALIEEATLGQVEANGTASRTNVNVGDTDDVQAKGVELELIYNPTRNWRIAANIAKQQTIVTNFSPRMGELLQLTDPLFGLNGSVADLSFFASADGNPPTYISDPVPTNNSIGEWLETNIYSVYRNKKLQEGRVSDEQRQWRANLITNYAFSEGRLKGFQVGGALRWQDGAAIGYPTELINGELVADIANPHMAPAETNLDAWVRYGRKIFNDRVRWTLELRASNLNTSADELIPVKSALSADYQVAVWRVGAPRIWRLTSSFKF